VKVWRVAAETRSYRADDLSGAGAALHPGRWNEEGQPVVYCAATLALAMLEALANLADADRPMNRFAVEITIPAPTWKRRARLAPRDLPVQWNAIPAGHASIATGGAWLAKLGCAIMEVPSAIVPEERVVLINPRHPEAKEITARVIRAVDFRRALRA
jgi:RES domain-containing protein